MLGALITDAPWTLVGGKGGAGKTTVAAALAIARADASLPTLVISLDPAHSLGDALAVELGPVPVDVPGVPGLRAMELDAERERARWLDAHRAALGELLEDGTRLAPGDIDELLDLAVPGADELASMLHLAEMASLHGAERLIIDTAPTGHALRLIETPVLAAGWTAALESLDARRRTVVETLSRRPLAADDRVRRFLDALTRDLAALRERLRDPARTRCVLVTNPEPMVAAETRRYRAALAAAGLHVDAVVVNRVRHAASPADEAGQESRVAVPLLPRDPQGVAALRDLASRAGRAADVHATMPAVPTRDADAPDIPRLHDVSVGARWHPPRDRALYLVAGKGGVGKTTVASALATMLAEEFGRRTILLSVDPAGSVGDAWGVMVGDEPLPAPGCTRLWLRQLDAEAAWAAFRASEYDGLAGVLARVAGDDTGALSGAIAQVVPPGLDELVALAELIRLVDTPDYDAVVIDSAPTGHFLRLLETPRLARDWSHAILRLMLRYRDVVGLDASAERVLTFAREVRRLDDLLRDPHRTCTAVVALPETLSVPETERLLSRLGELDIEPGVLLVNRLLRDGQVADEWQLSHTLQLLALGGRPEAVGAPALDQAPDDVVGMLAFAHAWRSIDSAPPTGHAA